MEIQEPYDLLTLLKTRKSQSFTVMEEQQEENLFQSTSSVMLRK